MPRLRLPISSQYVFVETMFGILLATIGWLEGVEGRANLPVRPSLLPGDSPPSDWIFVAYHMLLVGTLACTALMQQDRKTVSRPLLVFSGWCGLALPLVWSSIRPVPLGLVLPEMLRSEFRHGGGGRRGWGSGSRSLRRSADLAGNARGTRAARSPGRRDL